MKTTTRRATKPARTKALPSTPAPAINRKTKTLDLRIAREDLDAFATCARHFGLTPEMIMEHSLIGQLMATEDAPFNTLAHIEGFPSAENPVPVTLSFIPEAHTLLELAASLLRRPLEELSAGLLHFAALGYAGDMEDAEKKGGLDQHRELVAAVKRVIEAEFEARRGRMEKSAHGLDAWEWLQLERHRPSRFRGSRTDTLLSRKGGEA